MPASDPDRHGRHQATHADERACAAFNFPVWKHWGAQMRAQRVTVLKLSRACDTRAVRTGRSCALSVALRHRRPPC